MTRTDDTVPKGQREQHLVPSRHADNLNAAIP